ncbi:Berberine bridge enzyme-like 12 [Fusarium oxysporum f. sp. albedinis]|nr:Berberine bridge enzyme-like 12 [Fusarium oxysporum f. sp. albedinis]
MRQSLPVIWSLASPKFATMVLTIPCSCEGLYSDIESGRASRKALNATCSSGSSDTRRRHLSFSKKTTSGPNSVLDENASNASD